MRKFIGQRKKTYYTVNAWNTRAEALLIANKTIKTSFRNLKIEKGFIIGDKLYLESTAGRDPEGEREGVWVITTKGVK